MSPGMTICLDLSVIKGRDAVDGAGAIGSRDSYLVVGTVHFPSSSEIWLFLKSCITALSFRNKVPPIQSQWSWGQTKAQNLKLLLFL